MTNTELKDEQLENVTGGLGPKTGDTKGTPGTDDYAVYIKFPLQYSFMSGYFTKASIENLANTFIGYATEIKECVGDAERNAIKKLYGNNTSNIPANVKTILGIN